jgi:hypothetical protein
MCEECKRLRALLKEADDVIRLAYIELAKADCARRQESACFSRARFDQLAVALKAALDKHA